MGARRKINHSASPVLWEIAQPAARATDPASSLVAAERHERSGKAAAQRIAAFTAVLENPGRTSFELSKVCGLDRYQLARRLPELEARHPVRKGEERACGVTGNRAVTWWVK